MMRIIEIIFPVFSVMGLGYFIAQRRILNTSELAGLTRFVFRLALPVLLFYSLANSEPLQDFHWDFALAFYGVSYLVFGLGIWVSRAWFQASPVEQGIFGFGASYSNLLIVGLPILVATFGDRATLPLLTLVSVQSLLLFPPVYLMAQRGQAGGGLRRGALQIVQSPILIGLALGFLFQLAHIRLPILINTPISWIAQAALPVALIALGASLQQLRITRPSRQAWTMISFKLLLQPLLVWLLVFGVLHVEPLWAAVAVMAAGMPTGINSFMLAEEHQAGIETVSTSIVVSTLLTIAAQAFYILVFT